MKPAKVNTLTLSDPAYPAVLRDINHPPKQLFWIGAHPKEWISKPKVAIVGGRKTTSYGLNVTQTLASDLARAGVVIISGLAYGIDAAAHHASLAVGGTPVVVLPTDIEHIYPAANLNLARQITEQGGTIVSEYPAGARIYRSNFVARNRIVSGLADVLLITEAALKSGSLHTARFALEQGKTVMAVPGNILSPYSEGCNNLIKAGAVPVTSAEDVFFALGIGPQKLKSAIEFHGTPREQRILQLIMEGISEQEELAQAAKIEAAQLSSALTSLEISGHIRPAGAGNWVAS